MWDKSSKQSDSIFSSFIDRNTAISCTGRHKNVNWLLPFGSLQIRACLFFRILHAEFYRAHLKHRIVNRQIRIGSNEFCFCVLLVRLFIYGDLRENTGQRCTGTWLFTYRVSQGIRTVLNNMKNPVFENIMFKYIHS